MASSATWLIIGNPENRRVSLFQDALRQAGLLPAQVISYLALLNQEIDLADYATPQAVVRIESPGENFEVEKRILALAGVEQALNLEDERGRIYHPGAWFQGFSRVMDLIENKLGDVIWFNHPADIVTLFNKPLCKRLLFPYTLPPLPPFFSFDEFFAFVEQQERPRFFIKLNYSSSASGVVAYEFNRKRSLELAYSTVEVQEASPENKFYNSLKIRKYTDRKTIRTILDFLFKQGALVEPWVPKAKHHDLSYDLRVVAIAKERSHSIARLSSSPMTNLHLGNQRCYIEDLALSTAVWQQVDTLVEQCMHQFSRSLYAGLDIVLPRNGGGPILLEANAFGDLLPNLLHQGKTTYQREIEALCQKQGFVFG